MTMNNPNTPGNNPNTPGAHLGDERRRLTTETKASFKTTEFFAYLAAVFVVAITAVVVGDDGAGVDPFGASEALRYITYLTVGYMIARGLAKAGSRDSYDA